MKYLLISIFSLSLSGCIFLDGASGDGPSTIDLTEYLEECSMVNEESELDIRVRVYRDEYEGGQVVSYNNYVNTYYLTNDMSNLNNIKLYSVDEFGVPVNIPEDGTYILRVTCEANDCFTCCDGITHCPQEIEPDDKPEQFGRPFFQGASIEINQNYTPSSITIVPQYEFCE